MSSPSKLRLFLALRTFVSHLHFALPNFGYVFEEYFSRATPSASSAALSKTTSSIFVEVEPLFIASRIHVYGGFKRFSCFLDNWLLLPSFTSLTSHISSSGVPWRHSASNTTLSSFYSSRISPLARPIEERLHTRRDDRANSPLAYKQLYSLQSIDISCINMEHP